MKPARVYFVALLAFGCQSLSPGSDELNTDPCQACTSDQLCCDSQCVPIDESRCYACDRACSGGTPVCSAELRACACTTDSCAARSMLCSSGGACEPCSSLDAEALDIYVDASFVFDGSGEQRCPVRSISEALSAIGPRQGATVHVAAGVYGVPTRETFPLVLRGGVSLAGAGRAETIIRGSGDFLTSQVNGPADDYVTNVTVVAGDGIGTSHIRALSLQPELDSFTSNGILCDRGDAAAPAAPRAEPSAIVEEVIIGPGYAFGALVSTGPDPSHGGCVLSVDNADFSGNSQGILAAPAGTRRGGVAWQSIEVKASTFQGLEPSSSAVAGIGVVATQYTSSIIIRGNTFSASNGGVLLGATSGNLGAELRVIIEDNIFDGMFSSGLEIQSAIRVESLARNTFRGHIRTQPRYAAAIYLTAMAETAFWPQILRARDNRFIGNNFALVLAGRSLTMANRELLDFGRPGDPGGNVFRCNSAARDGGDQFPDVWIDVPGGGAALLAGNFWDHTPPTTDADGDDNGDDLWAGSTVDADTSGAMLASEDCPADRMP